MGFDSAFEKSRDLNSYAVPHGGVIESVLVLRSQIGQDSVSELVELDIEDSVFGIAEGSWTDANDRRSIISQARDEQMKIEDIPRLDGGSGRKRFELLGDGRGEIIVGRP